MIQRELQWPVRLSVLLLFCVAIVFSNDARPVMTALSVAEQSAPVTSANKVMKRTLETGPGIKADQDKYAPPSQFSTIVFQSP